MDLENFNKNADDTLRKMREQKEAKIEDQQRAPSVNDFVGKRILAKVAKEGRFYNSVVEEIKITEVSPSENWVKVQNMNGGKFWVSISEIAFVEVLKSLKDGKPLD